MVADLGTNIQSKLNNSHMVSVLTLFIQADSFFFSFVIGSMR